MKLCGARKVGQIWNLRFHCHLLHLILYLQHIVSTWGSQPGEISGLALTSSESGFYGFGGGDVSGTLHNELFRFDTGSNTWSEILGDGLIPAPRCQMGFTSVGEGLYVFGGRTWSSNIPFGDFFVFNTATNVWTQISSSGLSPSPRYGLGFTSASDGKLYLFGGAYTDDSQFGDLFQFDPETKVWTEISTSGYHPSPRQGMGFASTSERKLYVFGGAYPTRENVVGDFACFDLVDRVWKPIVAMGSPAARREPGFISILAADGNLFLFGGQGASGNLNDLIQYSPAENIWTEISGVGSVPPARQAMGFIATLDGMIFIYGGYIMGQNQYLGDFFRFDLRNNEWINCKSVDNTCTSCSSGLYRLAGYGCTECPAGMYLPLTGTTLCVLCPAGKYRIQTGDSAISTLFVSSTNDFFSIMFCLAMIQLEFSLTMHQQGNSDSN